MRHPGRAKREPGPSLFLLSIKKQNWVPDKFSLGMAEKKFSGMTQKV
jgi:hypothetical protein